MFNAIERPTVADFHVYELTITARIALPAMSNGTAQAVDVSKVPASAKTMLTSAFASQGVSVNTPVAVLGDAVPVDAVGG